MRRPTSESSTSTTAPHGRPRHPAVGQSSQSEQQIPSNTPSCGLADVHDDTPSLPAKPDAEARQFNESPIPMVM